MSITSMNRLEEMFVYCLNRKRFDRTAALLEGLGRLKSVVEAGQSGQEPS